MKLIRRQKIWLALVCLTNLTLWIIPSNVVEQIARDRHTMLGRYSRTHFYWIIAIAIFSVISFYVDWSTGKTYLKRWFQVLAVLLVLFPTLAVADFLFRTDAQQHYVRDRLAYHRPVDSIFHEVFEDKPIARRSYPDAPAGYAAVACTLRTDSRGYRNRTNANQYDVVVLGDSFAEGSSVSDDDVWPLRLVPKTGLSVYNLGMSGYDPFHYRESLREYGLSLKPRYVICLLYEGNDFRSSKSDRKRRHPSVSMRWKRYMKRSPILQTLDHFFIDTFGSLRCNDSVPGIEMLDWMPIMIPGGVLAHAYAFAPKQLRDLYQDRDTFAADKHWLNTRGQLSEMNRMCREIGAQFILVFAPTKAHVIVSLVGDKLPAEKVRAFTALRYKKELPKPDVFLENLLVNVNARESVMEDWCRRESIPFLSLTKVLQDAAMAGRQVYYTYDQHWTPPGHEVVARRVAAFFRSDLPADAG